MGDHFFIERQAHLRGTQIEELRIAVGWDKMTGFYDRILAKSYTHFSIYDNDILIAFVNVISDGIGDAYLVDLMVHPDYQAQGLGQTLVKHAIQSLKMDGIRSIEVIFDDHLEPFYRSCGFHIMKSGIIDTWEKKENNSRIVAESSE